MIRKFLIASLVLFGCYSMAGFVQASVFDIWTSSFTQTGEVLSVLSPNPGVVYAVCIDSASLGSGSFSIFNATATQAGVFFSTATIIDSTRSQTGCYNFNMYLSSGIAYTNSGTTPAKVNILWNRFSH